MTEAPAKKSDLGVRTLSAVVMLAVAGGALWLGGIWLDLLIGIIAAIAFVEFIALVLKTGWSGVAQLIAGIFGAAYIGGAAVSLILIEAYLVVVAVLVVVFTDTGAYFVGRKFGRRKIAPSISPSKSWEGLAGGAFAAGLVGAAASGLFVSAIHALSSDDPGVPWLAILVGALIGGALAVVAQAGDFLESWLKRKAGAKDSSNLLPGHGGVLDRIDGLLPVAIVVGAIAWALGSA